MTEQTATELNGFLLVDKPNGRTSSDCVQEIRRICGKKTRVGHAGTLDAFATGLLVIGIGRPATKLLSLVMELDKTYIAQAKLGQLTDTLDITGTTLNDEQPTNITEQQLVSAIASFGSLYKQVPPVYSALKYQGNLISRLARRQTMATEDLNKLVEEKSRVVHLYELKLTEFKMPFFTIKARVSHGTYIRSLCNDIARKLNTFATTHQLRRLAIGPFSVEQALPLHEFDSLELITSHLTSLEELQETIAAYKSSKVDTNISICQ